MTVQTSHLLMLDIIYGSKSIRQEWSVQGSKKVKVIGAGPFGGLSSCITKVNFFLQEHGLPQAKKIQQPEYLGVLKTYYILFVDQDLWDQKIKPIREKYLELKTLEKKDQNDTQVKQRISQLEKQLFKIKGEASNAFH